MKVDFERVDLKRWPQAKLYWVNCRIHTQLNTLHTCLKHSSHLFKAWFSGKVGSCFLKVHAASLIHPRKVTSKFMEYRYLYVKVGTESKRLQAVFQIFAHCIKIMYILDTF